jgi:MFS family permease
MLPLRRAWNLSEWEQQIVVSSTVLAACLGSLVMGSRLNESLGRCGAIQWAAIAFTIGSLLLLVAFNFTSLVMGRVVVGLGIGVASLTTPLYIAEVAVPHRRGELVTVNAFMVYVNYLYDFVA